MKKNILSIGCFLILLAISSCIYTDKKETASLIGQSIEKDTGYQAKATISPEAYKLAVSIYERQKDCPKQPIPPSSCPSATSRDCSVDYCGDNECIEKIICCHKISEDEFRDLTNDMNDGHAVFPAYKIHNITDDANCNSQWIRFSIDGTTYYINRLNTFLRSSEKYTTYYSVALLKSIADMGIKSVELYRGTEIVDGGAKVNFVPFKVNFKNGSSDFFDVSNDQP